MNAINTNAQKPVEQDVDLVLKNMKLRILGQPNDEVVIRTDSRHKHYKANEDREFLKMAYCSGNFLEKQVVSNTNNISSRSH